MRPADARASGRSNFAAMLLTAGWLAACAVAPKMPPLPATHPASPDADEAAVVEASETLQYERRVSSKPLPPPPAAVPTPAGTGGMQGMHGRGR
jgi:hypothetical protein